ncbi:MAG TPA: GYD domain-containing protein [Xanthobacteraceae bacterium]|nr:GYD domain-containing protein [Xanthobacteraceae bacterium]
MLFCITGQYTPQALNAMMDNPTTNRFEVAKKLVEAAGGKMISMYSAPADGPGVLAIFDVTEPGAAAAISGIVVASGTLHNVKLQRLLTQEEVVQVRQKAAQLRTAYKPPGK